MNDKPWIPLTDAVPEEAKTVETKIHDEAGERNHGRLKRRGNLWFFEDDSMYVYYRPTHWRTTR